MDGTQLRRLIERKRDGGALAPSDWAAAIAGYLAGTLPEAPLAALLMATVLRGTTFDEMRALTRALLDSGERLHFDASEGTVVDKHSSGGVGDSISLIAVPLAAACGVRVAKLSGRALGHTGGTLDKLEALGARTDLSPEEFVAQVRRSGCAIAAQSSRLVPADRKLYALRDQTATIPSVGLIAASIVSKKIAGGAHAIVYDVTAGRGAFLQTREEAATLAHALVALTQEFERTAQAFVTDMDQPLGAAIGSGIEALEARDVLLGSAGHERLVELAQIVAAALVAAAQPGIPTRAHVARALRDGSGYASLERLVREQGGAAARLRTLTAAEPRRTVLAPATGFIASIDAVALGELARELTERDGPFAGLLLARRCGDEVRAGDALGVVAGGDESAVARVRSAFAVAAAPPASRELVYEVVGPSSARSTEASK